MRICVPLQEESAGPDAVINGHFGSAPAFLICDTETDEKRVVKNNNQHHAHGQCQPVELLQSNRIDTVVCGGMGQGALIKLKAAGIQVFGCRAQTAQEAIDAVVNGKAVLFGAEHCCNHSGCHSHSS